MSFFVVMTAAEDAETNRAILRHYCQQHGITLGHLVRGERSFYVRPDGTEQIPAPTLRAYRVWIDPITGERLVRATVKLRAFIGRQIGADRVRIGALIEREALAQKWRARMTANLEGEE